MKIIAVDVDDTVVNMAEVWLDRYNADYNDNLRKSQLTDWAINSFVKPECGDKIYEYLDHRFYDDVKPIPAAFEGVQFLKKVCGYRVIFVTSVFPQHAGRKFKLLKDYGFVEDAKDYVECADKSLIKADVMIDDNYNHVINFTGFAFLYRQPWNKKYQWKYSVNDWYEIMRYFSRVNGVSYARI